MAGIQGVSSASYDLWQILTTAQANPTSASTSSTNASPASISSASDPFSNLNLTTTQQQQIAQVDQDLQNGTITPDLAQSQLTSILTPQQQQTLQTDIQNLQAAHQHHSRHHHSSGSALSQLGLTSDQQSQISQIIQSAQTEGTSPNDVLSQIEKALTPAQQQQLISEFSATVAPGQTSTATSLPSYVVNTTV
jgi:Spy/CpxP family protein refolding chaperone